jgi:hypothetical protein
MTERKLRKDPFFFFSYALVALVLGLQVFLAVWLEFV